MQFQLIIAAKKKYKLNEASRALSPNLGQRSILGKKGSFGKKGPRKFHHPLLNLFSKFFLSNVLHIFCKSGQNSIVECRKGLEEDLTKAKYESN